MEDNLSNPHHVDLADHIETVPQKYRTIYSNDLDDPEDSYLGRFLGVPQKFDLGLTKWKKLNPIKVDGQPYKLDLTETDVDVAILIAVEYDNDQEINFEEICLYVNGIPYQTFSSIALKYYLKFFEGDELSSTFKLPFFFCKRQEQALPLFLLHDQTVTITINIPEQSYVPNFYLFYSILQDREKSFYKEIISNPCRQLVNSSWKYESDYTDGEASVDVECLYPIKAIIWFSRKDDELVPTNNAKFVSGDKDYLEPLSCSFINTFYQSNFFGIRPPVDNVYAFSLCYQPLQDRTDQFIFAPNAVFTANADADQLTLIIITTRTIIYKESRVSIE